jgi:hypothetical protein
VFYSAVRRGGAALTEARRASIKVFLNECRTCLLADVRDDQAFGQSSPWGTAYDISPEAAHVWFVPGVRRAIAAMMEASGWRDHQFVYGQLERCGQLEEERLARRAQLRERLRGLLAYDFTYYWDLRDYRFYF